MMLQTLRRQREVSLAIFLMMTISTSVVLLPFSQGFSPLQQHRLRFGSSQQSFPSMTRRHMTNEKIKGDAIREATGIRPSLHPTTINAIAEALKTRASNKKDMPLRLSDGVQPLDIFTTAGSIAAEAISKREKASENDGMSLTTEEQQAIAGRVVGVVMRLDDLEAKLYDKVSKVNWVVKYNEWSTFGVVEDSTKIDQTIKDDPLFAMNRAECLLAIFLNTIEKPQLEKIGQSVPDNSKIDFLDSDRAEVLLEG